MVYKYIKEELLERLLPNYCPVTQQALSSTQNKPSWEKLLGKIHYPCPQCGLSLPSFSEVACGTCQQQAPSYDRVISAFSYQPPIRQMIQAFKFQRKLEYTRFFADQLQQAIQQHYAQYDASLPQLILPVPLHQKRLQQRGYNQAFEISQQLSRLLHIPLEALALTRCKATDEQSGLSAKQRRHNLTGAFTLRTALNAKHIAVVDDVMTTGTTAASIAKTLKQAGIEQVDIWVVARTPKFSGH